MPVYNDKWGQAIRDLLVRHGLTLRGASKKVGGVVSHMTVHEWSNGALPQNPVTAWEFLKAFSVEEARACLDAGNLPYPPGISKHEMESDIEKFVVKLRLEGRFDESTEAELKKQLKRIIETYDKP